MKSMPQRQALQETTEREGVNRNKGKKGEFIYPRSPKLEANAEIKGRLPVP